MPDGPSVPPRLDVTLRVCGGCVTDVCAGFSYWFLLRGEGLAGLDWAARALFLKLYSWCSRCALTGVFTSLLCERSGFLSLPGMAPVSSLNLVLREGIAQPLGKIW